MKLLPLSLLLACWPATAAAQWSSDPANNLVVADGAGDQAQPKLAPTPDGGCYLSWFDGIGTGYDLRLQRLDADGNEQWAHNGVLVADRSFSSTQDYGLDVDAVGNAALAFRDDRFGGVQVSANRVTPAGVLLWGVNGVQLTNTTDFVAAPRITAVASLDVVVSWTQNSSAKSMRLLGNGGTAWGAPVDMTPALGSYSVSDLHAVGDSVILALVHQTGAQIFTPKHLLAQKLDALGAPLWGAQPVTVYDLDSLQIGNFPTFVLDGSGGAVFAWYGTGILQCYAQHIRSSGAEIFPHNGVAVSTNTTNTRVSPSVAFDSATSSTYVFWEEQNSSQSMSGLSGQKLNATGARQWGTGGKTLIPLGTTEINWVRTLTTPGGAYVFWLQIPSFGQDTGHGAVVDGSGNFSVGPLPFASTPSDKLRLWATQGAGGEAFLAWTDAVTDSGDVLMQNFGPDGSLGSGAPGSAFCFGNGCPCGNDDPSAGCLNSTGSGAELTCSGSASAGADDLIAALVGAPANKPALFFSGTLRANGGLGSPLGDGLLCAGGMIVRHEVHVLDGAGASTWGPGLAASAGWSSGDLRDLQVWYRDPTLGPCATGFNLSNAYEVVFGP